MIMLVGAVGFDAAADEDAERSGLKSDGERQQGPHRQEGSKELFHGLSQTTQIADAVTDARIQREGLILSERTTARENPGSPWKR